MPSTAEQHEPERICGVKGCDRPTIDKRWCRMHHTVDSRPAPRIDWPTQILKLYELLDEMYGDDQPETAGNRAQISPDAHNRLTG